MAIGIDFQEAGRMGLTGVNMITTLGGTNTTVSGNATVALLITAVQNLAVTAGTSSDAARQAALGLQWALNAGLLSSSHGATTIAGLAAKIQTNLIYDIATTYDASLPQ